MQNKDKVVSLLPKTLKNHLPRDIAVISVGPKESQKLNSIYRGKDKVTNVLSIRYDAEYGEIILCPSVIRIEAKAHGNPIDYQFAWMVVHGMIHLAGIHHEVSEGAQKRVDRLEKQVLTKFFGKSKFKRQKAKVQLKRKKV